MKNFFKKLSFVMALAMIISVIAPAAGAFAASAPALTAKGTKYLQLGDAAKGTLDINVTNKPAGAKYAWSSSKTAVATVDKYGVVKSKKIGTTTISLAITKKDGKKSTLSVKVVVRDNIASLDSIVAKDGADLTKLVAGKEYDFDGKYTTASGAKSGTSSVARWFVNSDKATIDVKSGLFKATEGGEYEVTVYAFQTANGYAAWSALNDKASTVNVLTKNTFKVTVLPSLLSVEQVDADTVKLNFDTDMSKSTLEKDLVFYQILNNTPISTGAEKVKKVAFDTTGKTVTVDLYAPFAAGSTYKVVAGTFTSTFVAASTGVKNLKTIVFDDFFVKNTDTTGLDMLQFVKGVDENGVVIMTGAELAAAGTITFTYEGDKTKGFVSGTKAYLYTEGASSIIKAEFIGYVYDDTAKKFVEVKVSDSALATYTKVDDSLNNSSLSFILDGNAGEKDATITTGWANTFQLPAGDGLTYIHSRYQLKSASDATVFVYDDDFFTYTSSDPNKLLVTGQTMLPLGQGDVTVLVKLTSDPTKIVGTFTVQVIPARTLAGATASASSVTVSNTAVAGAIETGSVTITTKDSLQATVSDATTTYAGYADNTDGIEILSAPAVSPLITAGLTIVPTANVDGTFKLTFGAQGVTPGVYQIKVKVTSAKFPNAAVYTTVALVVQDASSASAVAWNVSLSDTSYDMKTLKAENILEKTITADVYGYNAKGARVEKTPNAKYDIKVLKDGVDVTKNVVSDATDDEINVVKKNVSNIYEYFTAGTYVVQFIAKDATLGKPQGAILGVVQLTLTDSTSTSVAVVNSSVTQAAGSMATVKQALNAAFEVKLNGTKLDLTDVSIVNIKTSTGATAVTNSADGSATITGGTTLYIESFQVEAKDTATTGTRLYTIEVKQTIAVK